jgi:hypothetical protein
MYCLVCNFTLSKSLPMATFTNQHFLDLNDS